MPSFPTNEPGTGKILGKVGEWLAATFLTQSEADASYAAALVGGRAPVRGGDLVVNVRDFGAVGDGVTDDTTAIRSAIASLPNMNLGKTYGWDPTPGGGTVYFPAGRYLTGGLEVGHYVRLLGDGQGSTVLQLKAGSNVPLVQNIAAQQNVNGGLGTHGIVLENMRLNGNKTQQTVGAPVVHFDTLWNEPAILNVIISDGSAGGLRVLLSDNLRTERSEFIHNTGPGVLIDGPYNTNIVDCLINFNTESGLVFRWSQNVRALASNAHHNKSWTSATVRDSYFEKNTGAQIRVEGGQGIRVRDSQLHTSTGGTTARIVLVNGARQCEVSGNTFTGNQDDFAPIIHLDASTSENVVSLLGNESLVKTAATTRRRSWVENLAGAANTVALGPGMLDGQRIGRAEGTLIGDGLELSHRSVTNYVRSSNDLTSTVWQKYNGLTAAATTGVDPWGQTVPVTRLTFGTNNFDYLNGAAQGVAPVAGDRWTFTVWARAVGTAPLRFRIGAGDNTSSHQTLEDHTFVPGEFRPYVVSHTFTAGFTGSSVVARIYNVESNPTTGQQLDVLGVVLSKDALPHLPIATPATGTTTVAPGVRSPLPIRVSSTAGIIMSSPDGTQYRLGVADGGTVTATAI